METSPSSSNPTYQGWKCVYTLVITIYWLAVHWFDKQDVFICSASIYNNTGKMKVCRRGSDEPLSKPLTIQEYNKFIEIIVISWLAITRYKDKAREWRINGIYYLLESSVINALCNPCRMESRVHEPPFSQIFYGNIYAWTLVQPLLDARCDPNNLVEKKRIGTPANIDCVRLRRKHFPVSRYLTRKTCTGCGYEKKGPTEKQSCKKT